MSKISIPGGLVVFSGALFWSLNSPLVTFLHMDPFLICWLRAAIGTVVLLPFLRPKQLNWNWWLPVYLISDCAVCLLVISALTMTSAPIAVGMQYTAPVWLFLCGWITTKKFRLRAFLPIAVILVGIVLFMLSGTDRTSNLGNLLAFFSGPAFALMTVSSRKAAGTNPLGLTALATAFMVLFIPILSPSCLGGIGSMTGTDWFVIAILGVVQVGAGYGLYNLGVQMVPPQRASIIALWEMILGPVWVALFFRIYPSVPVLIGYAFLLVGILLDARFNGGSTPAEAAE